MSIKDCDDSNDGIGQKSQGWGGKLFSNSDVDVGQKMKKKSKKSYSGNNFGVSQILQR